MTDSPRIPVDASESGPRRAGLALPATRYRHPGDIIRLIAAAGALIVAGTVAALAPAAWLRPGAAQSAGLG